LKSHSQGTDPAPISKRKPGRKPQGKIIFYSLIRESYLVLSKYLPYDHESKPTSAQSVMSIGPNLRVYGGFP